MYIIHGISGLIVVGNKKTGQGPVDNTLVGNIGFEPITSTTSMWRSSQMS